jgi:hypothetical protein
MDGWSTTARASQWEATRLTYNRGMTAHDWNAVFASAFGLALGLALVLLVTLIA